jgi:hypothetical protein
MKTIVQRVNGTMILSMTLEELGQRYRIHMPRARGAINLGNINSKRVAKLAISSVHLHDESEYELAEGNHQISFSEQGSHEEHPERHHAQGGDGAHEGHGDGQVDVPT